MILEEITEQLTETLTSRVLTLFGHAVDRVVLQPATLPEREVRILNRQLRQRTQLFVVVIERRQFAQQHIDRPTVANNMMGRQREPVLSGTKAQQARPCQRAHFQVEGSLDFFRENRCETFLPRA